MKFRLTTKADLPILYNMFANIIQKMYNDGIFIWNEHYPAEELDEDIENNRFYLLDIDGQIAAGFALCSTNSAESKVPWENPTAKACYIDRLGVNVDYCRKGIGGIMLSKAADIARNQGAEYLRLLVVDVNEPATKLYRKHGFLQTDFIYHEDIGSCVLNEYPFEKQL